MLKIIHRINAAAQLQEVPHSCGVEIDLRGTLDGRIILDHEPFEHGESFEEYIKQYKHKTLVANIKEAGIENKVKEILENAQVNDYFLLDVEHPYLYRASKNGERKIAVRFSEYEPIELTKQFIDKVDWVWIDTATQLPINKENISILKQFKTCLVCPERWGRPEDISAYKEKMKQLDFQPTAVMTAHKYIHDWSI